MEIVKDEVYNWHEKNERDQVSTNSPASGMHQPPSIQAPEGIRGHVRSEAPHRKISECEKN